MHFTLVPSALVFGLFGYRILYYIFDYPFRLTVSGTNLNNLNVISKKKTLSTNTWSLSRESLNSMSSISPLLYRYVDRHIKNSDLRLAPFIPTFTKAKILLCIITRRWFDTRIVVGKQLVISSTSIV